MAPAAPDDPNATEDQPVFTDPTPPRIPGLVLISTASGPCCRTFPIALGAPPTLLGREILGIPDPRVSRTHARIARTARGWEIEDAGSQNGTFVDGVELAHTRRPDRNASTQTTFASPRTLRLGSALLLPLEDITPLQSLRTLREGPWVWGPAMRAVLATAAMAATREWPLVIRGATGTGKEHVARSVHARSARASRPFVAMNCANLDPQLAEATLFGVRKGAFTGASESRPGVFQEAHLGVLFLDEVGELRSDLQAKLLRVLETGEIRPLGADRSSTVDVLVVSATHRALVEPQFRTDLYARLRQLEVTLPPLHARPEEIPWHVERILETLRTMRPSPQLIERCVLSSWPTNLRGLEGALKQASVAVELAKTTATDRRAHGAEVPVPEEILAQYLPEEVAGPIGARSVETVPSGNGHSAVSSVVSPADLWSGAAGVADDQRKRAIVAALQASEGNRTAVAKLLGIGRTFLYEEMSRLGIEWAGR